MLKYCGYILKMKSLWGTCVNRELLLSRWCVNYDDIVIIFWMVSAVWFRIVYDMNICAMCCLVLVRLHLCTANMNSCLGVHSFDIECHFFSLLISLLMFSTMLVATIAGIYIYIYLYHTWVWNRGICMRVIVRPRSHMLIVLKKVIPDTTRYHFA